MMYVEPEEEYAEEEGESWVRKYIRERTWADKILKE
jgi:hypothetical protein